MTETSLDFELRHRLQRALEHAGISPAEMADQLELHRNTVSNYLHGRTRPDKATLEAWAVRCHVSYAWLADLLPKDAGRGPDTDNKSFGDDSPETHSYPYLDVEGHDRKINADCLISVI